MSTERFEVPEQLVFYSSNGDAVKESDVPAIVRQEVEAFYRWWIDPANFGPINDPRSGQDYFNEYLAARFPETPEGKEECPHGLRRAECDCRYEAPLGLSDPAVCDCNAARSTEPGSIHRLNCPQVKPANFTEVQRQTLQRLEKLVPFVEAAADHMASHARFCGCGRCCALDAALEQLRSGGGSSK